MRRVLLFGLVACWTAAALPVLAGPEIPAVAINEKGKLLKAKRVRYLLRQLDLTPEQATHAEGLIEVILPDDEDEPPINVSQVRQLWTEIEQARLAGDKQKVEALTRQLQEMGEAALGDSEFFASMEPQLTPEQKKKLEQARARLDRNPSGAVRPLDLLRAARALDLSKEQQRGLTETHAAGRQRLGPMLRPSGELKLELINLVADRIRAVLTPEQRARFEYRVRALRPDLIDRGLRVSESEDQPAEPTAGEKVKPAGE